MANRNARSSGLHPRGATATDGKRRFSPSPALILSSLVLGAALVSLVIVAVVKVTPSDSPFDGRSLFLYADSSAAKAAAAEPGYSDELSPLVTTPSAIWLTPEEFPTDVVSSRVASIVLEATRTSSISTFVVYGVPGRDCGNQSSGGLDPAVYPGWIDAIAKGLEGSASIVVLEPDALALADQCGDVADRVAVIRSAVNRFAETDALVYLDGGHSNWKPVDEMASLLQSAGVSQTRGFATNVSNYNATADERAYADQLSSKLDGAHYIVDISRNGAGSDGQWCNPPGRRIGSPPSLDPSSPIHDGDLWIKTPGESDGLCNGGPPAGEWWTAGALALVG